MMWPPFGGYEIAGSGWNHWGLRRQATMMWPPFGGYEIAGSDWNPGAYAARLDDVTAVGGL